VIAPRSVRAAVRIGLLGLLLGACASLPPEKPVTSINDIVGAWRGTIQFGVGGPFQFVDVTINPDATMVMVWGINTRWGRVAVVNGRATFDLGIWTGTISYLEGPQGRVLLLYANFGVFTAQVSPVK
jgi:hypothetical protein